MKRLLIIRSDNIGDFVIFLGVMEYYADFFKDYIIDVVCKKSAQEFAENCPYIDKTIEYKEEYFELLCCGNKERRIKNIKKFLKIKEYEEENYRDEIDEYNYDVAIYPVYSRNPIAEVLLKYINAKEKIVFDGNYVNDLSDLRLLNNKYYTKVIKSKDHEMSEIERDYEFIRKVGYKKEIKRLNSRVWLSESNYLNADKVLEKKISRNEKYIVCCPGASHKIREWPVDKWSDLLKKLNKKYNFKIILCGDESDREIIEKIYKVSKSFSINLVNKLSIGDLAALIKKAFLMVGVESGPIHIAAAVNTPNVCIVGGGHFGRFYPYGDLQRNRIVYKKLECFGCNWVCKLNNIKCINNIEVDQVINEIDLISSDC